jgi:hypothetical protein
VRATEIAQQVCFGLGNSHMSFTHRHSSVGDVTLRDDTRGQAIQIGAVLLFGTLIIAFSSYQAFVVPDQNREVEFNHNQKVQGQLQEVRNAIVSVPGGNVGQSVAVDPGVTYPSRLVALNPGPAAGTLRTEGTTNRRYNLTIRNATTTGEAGDYWNGSANVYNTGGLVYAPNYNLYDRAPKTIYENSVLYNDGGDQSITITRQQLIKGDRITLVTLNGSFSTTRAGTFSVDLEALSTSTRTVTIRNQSHNVTIQVPTRLSATQWRNLTATEPNVRGLTVNDGAVDGDWGLLKLDLKPDTSYTLRMAKVGLGTGYRDPTARYILPVEGNGSTVPEGGTQRVIIEVRNRYNNPVSGAQVNASVTLPDASVTPTQQVTNENGQIVLRYNATKVDISGVAQRTERLNVSFDTPPGALSDATFDRQAPENATVELTIRNTDEGGGGISGDIRYNNDAEAADGPEPDNTRPAGINFSFTNEFDQAVTISEIEVDPVDSATDVLSDDASPDGEIARTEVYVDGDTSDAYVDYPGGTPLPENVDLDDEGQENNGNAEVSAGGNGTVYLYEFGTGSGEVNMTGQKVDIAITYQLENGLLGTERFTVTPTFSGAGGGGGGGSTAADRIQFVNNSQQADTLGTGSLTFDLENTGSSTATIEQVSVSVPSSSGNRYVEIDDSESGIAEIEINGGGNNGDYDSFGYSLGTTVTLDNDADIDAGQNATVALRYFRNNGGQEKSVADQTVVFTVQYSDGSQKEFRFQVPP